MSAETGDNSFLRGGGIGSGAMSAKMGNNSGVNELNPEFARLYEARQEAGDAVERLAEIMRILRGEGGCPWDMVQTHESIKQCLIEEAYEAKEAIERGDMDNLEEEMGDVLLQVVFHGEMASENSIFNLTSIVNRVSDKLIRRHPHIFSKESAKTIDKVIEKWENVKRQEKGVLMYSELLNSIPIALPSLTRSFKVQAKAAEAGFDWESVDGAFKKVEEETAELLDACRDGEKARLKDELGDLLFSVVNVARFIGVDPEDALSGASRKFIERFTFVENTALGIGKELKDMTFDELDELWEKAKQSLAGT
ncbi:MAG: nucleoside triphosphate pyrophosphohydrolase [Clostridiales Family XIII bacterium]|jgi:tetrapyrrole methylase family protein/MazG family protein|nr:nucleoside triphosphate pyrophosphohydrolase [Clostridiales Family XIII bacterium]